MTKDSIGNRMKEFYENRSKTYLTCRTPVIIRIDGCHFHTFTKGFKRPFDSILMKTMQETTKNLCENIQGCKLGYTQSDEISLLLTDYDNITTSAWFGNSVQKICSVSAALATMYFNKNLKKNVEKETEVKDLYSFYNEDGETQNYRSMLLKKLEVGAYFDSRCFNIPQSEVCNYFIWRQQDCTKNSVSSLARKYFSDKELHCLNGSQMQDKLHEKKGVNWNDCSDVEKRGTCVIKNSNPNSNRSNWIIDEHIPIFTQDRDYIESRFPKN